MTFLECTVHCHTSLCDGEHTPEEMVKAAFSAGVNVLGFSGHSYTSHDSSCCMSRENTVRYRREVSALKAAYAGRLSILCGLEWDAASDDPPEGWDYFIGSVHYLKGPVSGRYHAVDNTPEELSACLAEFGGDGLAMAEAYFSAVARAAASRPTILGHFDLIKKLNGGGRFFDEDHPRYQQAALAGLEAAFGKVGALEINTGGLARGWRQDLYPAPFLLRRWRQLGGEAILTADAHTAEGLLFGFEQAAQAARKAGFDHLVVLDGEGKLIPCPL